MKKITALILTAVMVLSMAACGGGSKLEEPNKERMKGDVQEYITAMVDGEAKITYFTTEDSKTEDNKFEATCVATYESPSVKYVDEFLLVYSNGKDAWNLEKCSIVADYEGKSQTEIGGGETEAAPSGETTTAAVETEAATTAPEAPAATAVSDSLSDYTFMLNGTVYQLPFAYSIFKDAGWTISSSGDNEDMAIAGMSYEYIKVSNNGSQMWIYVYNASGNAKALKDCKIGGIELEANDLLDPTVFSIAGGINLLSSLEDIQNAFGSANNTNNGDDYTVLTYGDSSDRIYSKFFWYNTDDMKKYSEITLMNMTVDENDATETNTDVPEYLSTYVAPTELGNDILSGNIEIEGDLYHLPAPVTEFMNKGWEITSKPNAIVAGQDDSIRLERDGHSIYVYVMNFAAYQTIPENCAVYNVYIESGDVTSCSIPGVTITSAKADVEKAVTADFSYNKGSYDYSYDYYGDYVSVGIDVDLNTETVSEIHLKNSAWQ